MIQLPDDFSFGVVIYPNPDDPKSWAAHSLEMDLMGFDETVQGALAELFQAMDGQLRNAPSADQVFFPASGEIWAMLSKAKRLPDEILERAMHNVFGSPVTRTIQHRMKHVWGPSKALRYAQRELATV